jgi:ketosteroid isomerase-like protein
MQWMQRRVVGSTAVLIALMALGCAPADDEAAVPADTVPSMSASEPPAELQQASASMAAAWNAEDAAAVAAFLTEDAMLMADTLHLTGRQQIMEQWITPALPAITSLQVMDEQWEPAGQDFRTTGRYSLTVTGEDGQTMTETGRYDDTWTRDADGRWRVRSMNVTADPAPATTTGQ